jgi:formamidopyrimidine-DNA glycosylase
MPELPEVETVCRSLRPHLLGRTIERIDVRERRLRVPVDRARVDLLAGKKIESVDRLAKYILLRFSDASVWLFHLGMSGKLICTSVNTPRQKHDHIVVDLDDGRQLRYHDPRRFGLAIVTHAGELGDLPQLRRLGVDPFAEALTGEYLFSFTRASERRIRDLLLDQQIVAGLGNIYANEVLAMVRLRPTTRAWRLTRKQVGMIAAAIPELLLDAIQWCGTSFSDYRDADDKSGEFQNHLRVYDRDGEPCRVCPSIVKRVAIGNRSAFYCPTCQK